MFGVEWSGATGVGGVSGVRWSGVGSRCGIEWGGVSGVGGNRCSE